MRRIILLLLFITLSTNTFAQFRFGAKIALTSNNVLFEPHNGSIVRIDMFHGNGGLVANYSCTKVFSIQSELIFNTLGANYSQYSPYYINLYGNLVQSYNETKIRLSYLEIPLLAKFTIFGNQKVNLNILGGAFLGYRLSAKEKTGGDSFQNVTDAYTAFNAGYSIAFGFSCMKQRLFFELRGNRGLVNINTLEGTKIHTIQGQYSVGYYLFQGKKK